MAGGESSDARERAVGELQRAWRGLAAAQRRLRGRDAKHQGELSVPQYNLLQPLIENDRLSSSELSAHAGLTAATTTHMLEQLAAAGIVTRERSKQDRRVVITSLTERGRKQVTSKDAALQRKWRDAVADLDQSALEQATAVLRRLIRYVDEL